jgi:hypothetical protein
MAILSDGRTTASVKVIDPPTGASGSTNVIADTGAELSTLPDFAVGVALAHVTWGPTVTFYVAGTSVSTLVANGATSEVEDEPHGGGARMTKTATAPLHIHYVAAGTAPFTNFEGMFGMDLMDAFEVDPVKDQGKSNAYLARRV